MITIKDPIEEHNKKVCHEIDEHNKKIPLKQREELNMEAKCYANSLLVGRMVFLPSEAYRKNWDSIFGNKHG